MLTDVFCTLSKPVGPNFSKNVCYQLCKNIAFLINPDIFRCGEGYYRFRSTFVRTLQQNSGS